jgi:hypothetical protein
MFFLFVDFIQNSIIVFVASYLIVLGFLALEDRFG